MELNIRLDQSGRHLYEQIYEYIREEIIRGELRKDEKLPSSRSLAANLGVARSTVDFAYSQLADEGYIRARRSSGFYVCGIEVLRFCRDQRFQRPQGIRERECDRFFTA